MATALIPQDPYRKLTLATGSSHDHVGTLLADIYRETNHWIPP
jgi:hypothetical protein